MPELVPEIHALFAEGMIDGWRAVTYIGPIPEHRERGLTLDQIVIGDLFPVAVDLRFPGRQRRSA